MSEFYGDLTDLYIFPIYGHDPERSSSFITMGDMYIMNSLYCAQNSSSFTISYHGSVIHSHRSQHFRSFQAYSVKLS